jgi:hypothetical protein
MEPTATVLASGLKLLSFQGVTTFQGRVVVATIEADLIWVAPDGSLTPWVNLARYGIPTGIFGLNDRIAVALSAQESGHFLMQVTEQGKISRLADLSELVGEFGAPFAVTAQDGRYPYYLVAVSTNVSGSSGLIAQVMSSGRISILARLANSPFGVGMTDRYALATQENGQILRISFATGAVRPIADLVQADLGSPLDLTPLGQDWITTTTTGWLVALKPDNRLLPLLNTTELNVGAPTTLTSFAGDLIVATQNGNLLRVAL